MTTDATSKPSICNFDISTAGAIACMDDEKAGRIFRAFCRHCLGLAATPPVDEIEAMLYGTMCDCHDRMTARFLSRVKAGAKAAEARWSGRNADAMRTHNGRNATDGQTDGRTDRQTDGTKKNYKTRAYAPMPGRDGIRRGTFAPQETNKRGLE